MAAGDAIETVFASADELPTVKLRESGPYAGCAITFAATSARDR
jgi:hypothetical protein